MYTRVLIPSMRKKLGMAVSMDNPSFGGGGDIGCSDFYMPACTHTYEHEYAHTTHAQDYIKSHKAIGHLVLSLQMFE